MSDKTLKNNGFAKLGEEIMEDAAEKISQQASVEFKLNVEIIKETDPGSTTRQYCPSCGEVRNDGESETLWPEFKDLPDDFIGEVDHAESLCPTCLLGELKAYGYDLSIVAWRAIPKGQ